MGFTFRDGHYQRRVYFGKRTIKRGECAMIWKLSGRCKKIEGPKLVRLWFSTIRFCTRFTANESQYLCIEFKDGHTENIKGPTSIYKDHLLHSNISVKEAVNVGKHEAIVVYTNEKGKGSVNTLTESIKRGPLVFFPAVNQTLKTFQHCVGGELKDRMPSYKPSVKISLMERNNVITRSFKSKDNYSLNLSLSLTWKISDVSMLLKNPQKPLKVLINALANDVTNYAVHKNYVELLDATCVFSTAKMAKQKKTSETNKLPAVSNVYKSLFQCAKHIGVDILDISYQGSDIDLKYEQKLQMERLKKKEQLQEKERANAKERLEDFKLSMALARADKQTKKEFADMQHRQKLLDEAHKAKLKRERETFEQSLLQEKSKMLLKTEFYKSLQETGVDLTKYLVATVSSKVCAESTQNVNTKEDAKGI